LSLSEQENEKDKINTIENVYKWFLMFICFILDKYAIKVHLLIPLK